MGLRRHPRTVRLACLGVLWLLAPLASAKDAPPAGKGLPEQTAVAIGAQVQPYVYSGALMGLVVGVISKKGHFIRGYGRLAADMATPPDAGTIYEIGSISKVFTGVLLAALIGDGTVQLDQTLQSLLPAEVKLKPMDGVPITLRHLSTHTSGLPRMPSNFHPKNPGNPYVDYSSEQLHAALKNYGRRKTPGEAYAYSNLAVGLLGEVLCGKVGQTYEQLLAERITAPLGMTSTSLALTESMRKRLAPPYDAQGGVQQSWDLGLFSGAGGIRSSMQDMLRFAQANLTQGEAPLSKTLPQALALAREVQSKLGPGKVQMGLGWHISPSGACMHNGQTGGYHSFMALDAAKGTAVVILSNTAAELIDRIGAQVGKILAGEKVAAPKVQQPVSVDSDVLAAYVGRYELAPTFILTITVEAGTLFVQATGQPRLRTRASSDTTFVNYAAKAEIVFERDDAGKVSRLVLHQGGQKLPAKRLP